jgi:hypothetical protein
MAYCVVARSESDPTIDAVCIKALLHPCVRCTELISPFSVHHSGIERLEVCLKACKGSGSMDHRIKFRKMERR